MSDTQKSYQVTREKHLDHLVRVVPFITLAYAFQSYLILQLNGPLDGFALFMMGGLLGLMIGGFVTYDNYHQVTLFEDHLTIHFLGLSKKLPYSAIIAIHVHDPKESFGSVLIESTHGSFRFFFVDDAAKIKQWIDSQKQSLPLAA